MGVKMLHDDPRAIETADRINALLSALHALECKNNRMVELFYSYPGERERTKAIHAEQESVLRKIIAEIDGIYREMTGGWHVIPDRRDETREDIFNDAMYCVTKLWRQPNEEVKA